MSNGTGFDGRADLVFFGKISASISHELQNVMAIISEAAGFLGDLTEMAKKGGAIQLDMLQTCSKEIQEEIHRGFDTIQQMNRFAHSVDDEVKQINLTEVITMMIRIAGFLSIAAKVHFDPPDEAAPLVLTCPWRLQNLIYHALVFAFESVGPDGDIQVSLHPKKNGSARITFSGLGLKAASKFPMDQTIQVAESISAEIVMTDDARSFDILVPQYIKGLT